MYDVKMYDLLTIRQLNLLCRHEFLADLDIDRLAFLGVLGLHVTHTDSYFGIREHDTRGDVSDGLAFGIANLIAVTRNSALQALEMYQFAFHSFGFLGFEEIAVNEILGIQFGNPS